MPDQTRLSFYDFDLPERLIAQAPVTPRDAARLLHVSQTISHKHVCDLPELVRAGDILVLNDTRVIPARLFGMRGQVKIELLLHMRQDDNLWEVFARPLKRLHINDRIMIADDFYVDVVAIKANGLADVRLNKSGAEMMAAIHRHGRMPLPPYIKRDEALEEDKSRYQTVYAREEGSVAAPTAGLHFTPELLRTIGDKGVALAHVTLHVGAGTFLPVKVDDVSQHVMHGEWASISSETAKAINAARAAGGRVIAVGTTATRVLETVADDVGTLKAWEGETRIFITPGYRFKCVDCLMTNFHLPKSTLFMLVCAFAGAERMKEAYKQAIAADYRFFSYGDACFLEKA